MPHHLAYIYHLQQHLTVRLPCTLQADLSCTICPAGYYQPSTGQTVCLACPKGYFSYPGASACLPCSPGFFAYRNATARCTMSRAGFLANAPSAATAELACGVGRTSITGICRIECVIVMHSPVCFAMSSSDEGAEKERSRAVCGLLTLLDGILR